MGKPAQQVMTFFDVCSSYLDSSGGKRGSGNPIASGYFVFSLCAVLCRSGLFFGKLVVRESVDSLSEVKHVLRNIFRYEHAFLNFRSGDAFDDI